jgi:hypothetical protein
LAELEGRAVAHPKLHDVTGAVAKELDPGLLGAAILQKIRFALNRG